MLLSSGISGFKDVTTEKWIQIHVHKNTIKKHKK